MKIKRIAILGCVLILMLALPGCWSDSAGDKIVAIDSVEVINVQLFSGKTKTFTKDDAKTIASHINLAEKTNRKSVQDTPDITPLGIINIDDEDVIYYYTIDNCFYIERPYVGIYKLQDNIDEYISQYN